MTAKQNVLPNTKQEAQPISKPLIHTRTNPQPNKLLYSQTKSEDEPYRHIIIHARLIISVRQPNNYILSQPISEAKSSSQTATSSFQLGQRLIETDKHLHHQALYTRFQVIWTKSHKLCQAGPKAKPDGYTHQSSAKLGQRPSHTCKQKLHHPGCAKGSVRDQTCI